MLCECEGDNYMVEQQDRRSFRSRYVDQSYLGDTSENELPCPVLFFYYEISTCPFIASLICLPCYRSQMSAPLYHLYILNWQFQESINVNAFFWRSMFAFNNIHLYLTLQLVNFWKKNIYIQLQSSLSNAAKIYVQI